MFLVVVSVGVVIYEKLPNGHCENRRELGAQASSCEPHLASVRRQTVPTLPHPSPTCLSNVFLMMLKFPSDSLRRVW